MNTNNSVFIDRADSSNLMYLAMIERVEDGVYRIELLSQAGTALTTTSRVTEVDVGDGEVIQEINFDSEEYGKLMMKGLIFSRPICHAIGAFHKAQKKNSS